MRELGFFFFFKMAVAVSSSCVRVSVLFRSKGGLVEESTSFFSAPEASLSDRVSH